MIEYLDIMKRLADNGWSGRQLQLKHLISNGTLAQIRTGKPISTATIDIICRLCNCQPGDLLRYIPDEEAE